MEKRILNSLLLLMVTMLSFGQAKSPEKLLNARQNSWVRVYYRIPADSVLVWVNKDEINFEYLNQLTPALVVPDSLDSDSVFLPKGQYIEVESNYELAYANWYEVTETGIAFSEDRRKRYLFAFERTPEMVSEASVKTLKSPLKRKQNVGGFELPNGRWTEHWLLVATTKDTLITRIEREKKTRINHKIPFYKRPFKYWPIVRFVYKIPQKTARLFDGYPSQRKSNRLRKKFKTEGFVLFSKPLYKPGDTLRLKAWLTDGKENPLTETQTISVGYQKNNRYTSSNLGKLSPVSPGSYVYELPLPDSFPSDTRYSFYFQGKKDIAAFNASFQIEEYKLPDISSFTLSTAKKSYLPKDTLALKIKALDATGLPILDGQLEWFLLTRQINRWNSDTLFIPDTLYHQSKPLLTAGETLFQIPVSDLPPADMEVRAKVILRNSNNERQEKTTDLTITQSSRKIEFIRSAQGLRIAYLENEVAIPALAMLTSENDYWSIDTLLQLPATIIPHPLVATYDLKVLNETGKIIYGDNYEVSEDLSSGFQPSINPLFEKDSIGFQLQNPDKQMVLIAVYSGKKILWEDSVWQAYYSWKIKANERWLYQVKYSYIKEGKPVTDFVQLGLPYKWLQVQTNLAEVVQPGATDTMLVRVTDYLDRPVSDVNISAVAYNEQLKDKIILPEIPLVHNYKKRKTHRSPSNVEENTASLEKTAPLFRFKNIQRFLGTDTMHYYQSLYNEKSVSIQRSIMKSPMPEIAVHAQKEGVPEPLYIIYINNQPIWSSIVNTRYTNSYALQPGFVKLAIRTKSQLITVDSLYLQPFFKHDVFLNLSALTADPKAILQSMPDTFLASEKSNLESYFIRFEKHSDNYDAWVWQKDRLHKLNYWSNDGWIAGPFEDYLPLKAWKKDSYSTTFPMEKRYTYRLANGLVRMEKTPLLPGRYQLNNNRTFWRIGEEIPTTSLPPVAEKILQPKYKLFITRTNYQTEKGKAAARLFVQYDSSIAYQVWLPVDSIKSFTVNNGPSTQQHNLAPGSYYLLLIKEDGRSFQKGPFLLQSGGTLCITINQPQFDRRTAFTDSLPAWQQEKYLEQQQEANKSNKENTANNTQTTKDPTLRKGDGVVRGFLSDKATGIGIPGAAIAIKGSRTGTTTNQQGFYEITGLANGSYTLIYSSVGYVNLEKRANVWHTGTFEVNAMMEVSEMDLNEVVVTGYGVQYKRSLTGSVSTVTGNNFNQMLQGRLAGVQVTSNQGAAVNIQIRGINSYSGNFEPIYVVDGVIMEGLPSNLDTANMNIQILKGSAATTIYGSRAANGVILIQTGAGTGPVIRSNFSDYAYWRPNQVTNAKGEVRIPLSYPDNLTNWQHAVYAAAPKGRYGKVQRNTKTFKAIQGQLAVPDFLVEGDSTYLIGKAMNYTAEDQVLATSFTFKQTKKEETITVNTMDAATPDFGLLAPAAPDTLKPVFKVSDSQNRTDGETRSIPVFEKGTRETNGSFFLLAANDTTVSYLPARPGEPITVFATHQLIDLLEKELESLKDYPYACMEQTANKLWGLLMMQSIYEKTGKRFPHEKLMGNLKNKLLKSQLPEGGFPWWTNGEANLYITTRVLQALRQLPPDESVKNTLRNGYLYLQNALPRLNKDKKLEALYALSQGGHVYPYKAAVDSIAFDSLTLHQQWQYFSIAQQHSSFADSLWQKLWQKRTESVLGALYWGQSSRSWYNTTKATSVVAFRAIAKDSSKLQLLPRLQQYFLEAQKEGFGNTVEKAEITHLLLKEALKNNDEILQKSMLKIADNEEINQFPFTTTLTGNEPYLFRKTGAGIVYLTAFQQWQNKEPQKVDSLFELKTRFIQHSDPVLSLKSGIPATIELNILTKKSAEFLMLEIPIPAGCVVTQKPQVYGQHREYLKGKVLVFIEQLDPGNLQIDIPLEVRFRGNYTLNPARLELMYQPVFFGRNELKTISVK